MPVENTPSSSSLQELAFDPADPKAALAQLPRADAVFALYGAEAHAEPYIGRTPNLQARLARLLQPSPQHPRRLQLAGRVRRIAWRLTGSEFESLLFQFDLLQNQYGPKALERMHLRAPAFVRFLGGNPYPRVVVTHRPSQREAEWAYGPFSSRAAAERFAEEMLKLFLLRRCTFELDPDPAFPYLASKWQGEQAVRGSGLDWVIVRSSVIFGPGDGFFRQLAGALRVPSPFLVIPGDGQALFQPIAVGDVARCLRAAVEEPARRHQVYEIGGPEHLTLEQITRAVAVATGRDWFLFSPRRPLRVPVAALMPVGALMDRLLPNPPVTAQQLALLARVNATRLDAVPAAFGFDPEPLATHLQSLRPRRRWASPPSRPV